MVFIEYCNGNVMSAQCQSVLGPCKEVCDLCIASYNSYVLGEAKRQIKEAIRLLEAQGYTITPPDVH